MFGLFIFVWVQNSWLGISQCWKFVGSTHFLVLQISVVILQVQPTHPTSEKVPTKWRRLETTQRALRSLGSTVGLIPGLFFFVHDLMKVLKLDVRIFCFFDDTVMVVKMMMLMIIPAWWISSDDDDSRLIDNGNGRWVPQGKDEALVWYHPHPHHYLNHEQHYHPNRN